MLCVITSLSPDTRSDEIAYLSCGLTTVDDMGSCRER